MIGLLPIITAGFASYEGRDLTVAFTKMWLNSAPRGLLNAKSIVQTGSMLQQTLGNVQYFILPCDMSSHMVSTLCLHS